MATKLHIDMSQGVIDIEGDPDLVREIYRDMKEHLLSRDMPLRSPQRDPERAAVPAAPEASDETKPKIRRRPATRRKTEGDTGSSGVSADAPKLDRDLDTSKLAAFYGQYEPKNHPEKILIFLSFLTEELGIESPNTDQVYTCYVKANERVPKAFAQAFRDASGRTFGFIDYRSAMDMRITTAGTNHFKFDLKRKSAE